jgi:hypothetical protein
MALTVDAVELRLAHGAVGVLMQWMALTVVAVQLAWLTAPSACSCSRWHSILLPCSLLGSRRCRRAHAANGIRCYFVSHPLMGHPFWVWVRPMHAFLCLTPLRGTPSGCGFGPCTPSCVSPLFGAPLLGVGSAHARLHFPWSSLARLTRWMAVIFRFLSATSGRPAYCRELDCGLGPCVLFSRGCGLPPYACPCVILGAVEGSQWFVEAVTTSRTWGWPRVKGPDGAVNSRVPRHWREGRALG